MYTLGASAPVMIELRVLTGRLVGGGVLPSLRGSETALNPLKSAAAPDAARLGEVLPPPNMRPRIRTR